MRKPKKLYPRRCALCSDNRKRKVYYYFPMPDAEDGPYHNPWVGQLLCKKHAPDPLPWLLGLDEDEHKRART